MDNMMSLNTYIYKIYEISGGSGALFLSFVLSLSLSLSLPFLWGVGKSDCKTVHFYFPALEPWPGPENKNVTFSLDAFFAP